MSDSVGYIDVTLEHLFLKIEEVDYGYKEAITKYFDIDFHVRDQKNHINRTLRGM